MALKLGRKPRTFDSRVPHYSAMKAAFPRRATSIPEHVNYLSAMPDDLGMMLNDSLGDCTIAAAYHAIQLWTFAAAGKMQTDPDSDVESVYEQFCGYVPGDPQTDQGGVEQVVLRDWLKKGVPIIGGGTNKLAAFFEIDPRNLMDVCEAIDDCGLVYIGFGVPSNILPPDGNVPELWTYDPSATSVGGHAVILPGFNRSTVDNQSRYFNLVSWGAKYRMTFEFFQETVDEVYALGNQDWVKATGKTPLGLTLAEQDAQMAALAA